jgi:hypothetical protein
MLSARFDELTAYLIAWPSACLYEWGGVYSTGRRRRACGRETRPLCPDCNDDDPSGPGGRYGTDAFF